MEDRIRVLPDRVANLIAAGEVVQNPSSVVKEMMENSIDAGASEVMVNYRNGGSELIQIVDNGAGMSPNDARMAFEKHATSKIKDPEDLYALNTFGFRGEALASIASVSQVELRTRSEGDNIGTVSTINGGRFIDQQPMMCDVGSNFYIRNLFYNIPARKKFIDGSKRCANQIKAEFRRVALCNPEVNFELYDDSTLVYKLPATNTVGRIVDVVGRSIKRNLLEVETETSVVRIVGYIGRPESAKRGMADQYLFVNGRYFKSLYLHSAITKGYEKIIAPQLNPSYFIFIEVEANRIDVNVHPQKTEVKFQDRETIWQILNAAVRESLAKSGSVPMMDFNSDESVEIPILQHGASYSEPQAALNRDYNPFAVEYTQREVSRSKILNEYDSLRTYEDREQWESGLSNEEWSDIEMGSTLEFASGEELMVQGELKMGLPSIGGLMLSGRYAWCSARGGVRVVDLKRASERLVYEGYLEQLTAQRPVSQGVLFPIELQLSDVEYSCVSDNLEKLQMAGFEIALGRDHRISVSSLPANISSESVDMLIYELIQLLSTPEDMAEHQRSQIAAALARAAVAQHRGDYQMDEAREIVTKLLAKGGDDEIARTPSGKSIALEISLDEIKKRLN